MRPVTSTLATAALFALFSFSSAHAVNTPSQQQIQAAVDAAIAKKKATIPIAIRIDRLLGCQQSPEVKEEVVCLVAVGNGEGNVFSVMPLRLDGDTWVGVERKGAEFPGPTAAEVQALIRAAAEQEVSRNPEAAKIQEVQEALTTLQVKQVNTCELNRKNGHLLCSVVLTVPDRPEIKSDFAIMLDSKGWRFVPR